MVTVDERAKKRKNDETESSTEATRSNSKSPPCSPASVVNNNFTSIISNVTPSPVQARLNLANWIRTVVSPLPSKPSAELEQFLLLGNGNLVDVVVSRAYIILGVIFPSDDSEQRLISWSLKNVNLMDRMWSEQRGIEATKLYYKVLESICRSESEKLSAINLRKFLTNEKFHRCMLACSAELVAAAHTSVNILFPSVLERIGITAFDMSKVIESFIKHEDSLPRELRRHLNSLEEKLLESMVWDKGSSLYNCFMASRPDLSNEIQNLKLLAEPMPPLDEIARCHNIGSKCLPYQQVSLKDKSSAGDDGSFEDCCGSELAKRSSSAPATKDDAPVPGCFKAKLPPPSPSLQAAFSSPSQRKTSSGGGSSMNAAINSFFSKMNKLAAVRINTLAERLKLSQDVREKIYSLFQKILTQKTYLFFNRHVDQIMLCCFYIIAKCSKFNLTFENIKDGYTKQWQCKYHIFLSVSVSQSSQYVGNNAENHIAIISFYNQIFLPNVRSLLDEVSGAGAFEQVPEVNNKDTCPSSPWMSPFRNLPDISPKKVSPSQNVYLSPRRPSKDALISPAGKSYYAFIGERTCAYRSPSEELNEINRSINRSQKRRRTLKFDDADVSFISDSFVAKSLFPQDNECR